MTKSKIRSVKEKSQLNQEFWDRVRHDDFPEVERLLDEGADVNASFCIEERGMYYYDRKALWMAVLSCHTELVQLLLDKGADVNAENGPHSEKWTALMAGAQIGHVDKIKLLLDKGAKIDAQDAQGMTALMYAVEYNETDAVRLFVKRGANRFIKDRNGRNAIMHAKRQKIINILMSPIFQRARKKGRQEEKAKIQAIYNKIDALNKMIDERTGTKVPASTDKKGVIVGAGAHAGLTATRRRKGK